MLVSRAFVAACASCMTTLALYPLDTVKTARHLNRSPPTLTSRTFAGCVPDACGTFAATGTYFLAYERVLACTHDVPLSSFVGISVAGLVITPTDVIKRRAQVTKNNMESVDPITPKTLCDTYLLGLAKNAPKAMIKYSCYEAFLRVMGRYARLDVAGGLSAMLSAILVTLLFTPLDVLRTHAVLGRRFDGDMRGLFRGMRASLLQSVVGNGFGHFLLEHFAPRR